MRDDDATKTIEITEPVKRETEKALLVEIGGEELWIPKSQIHDDSEVYREGDTGKLVITEWIAREKGLL
jgi:hypothetical protein